MRKCRLRSESDGHDWNDDFEKFGLSEMVSRAGVYMVLQPSGSHLNGTRDIKRESTVDIVTAVYVYVVGLVAQVW